MRRGVPAVAVLVAIVTPILAGGCSGSPTAPPGPTVSAPTPRVDTALRAELLQMMADDQLERTGDGLPPGTRLPPIQDYARAKRLGEIIDDVGWPTHALVGEDGGTAAWLIAQHADHDVEFQQRALDLIGAAAHDGEADVTEVAYLEDRVAVNTDRPQTYGTQVRCRDGRPRPATPLARPHDIEELRRDVGLDPLRDYYAELAMMCAQEEAAGVEVGPG